MGTTELSDTAARYQTRGGVLVTRRRRETPYADAISGYIDALDSRRGAVFSSNYEYPAAIQGGTPPLSTRRWASHRANAS
jgi:anthranilate synthase